MIKFWMLSKFTVMTTLICCLSYASNAFSTMHTTSSSLKYQPRSLYVSHPLNTHFPFSEEDVHPKNTIAFQQFHQVFFKNNIPQKEQSSSVTPPPTPSNQNTVENFKSYIPSIETFFYTVKADKSLYDILKGDLRLPKSIIEGPYNFFQKVKNWNRIKDPDNVKKDVKLYLEVPYGSKLAKHLKHRIKYLNTKRTKKKIRTRIKRKSSFFAFYSMSTGFFSEEIDTTTSRGEVKGKLDTTQHSPITFGIGGRWVTSDYFGLSSSFYFSKLFGVSTETKGDVSIPLELGVNGYIDYLPKKSKLSPYGGFDYESFSTFNTDELLDTTQEATIRTRQHKVLYATLGLSYLTITGNTPFILKVSYSKSLSTSSDTKSNISDKEFEGSKFMIYASGKVYKSMLAHILYKQHMMEGPTDLLIRRIGVGVGFSF